MAAMPYTVDAVAPSAMSESMLGAPCARLLKPPLKYLKFTAITGMSSKNCVNANVIMFSWPKKHAGSGHENMWPIER